MKPIANHLRTAIIFQTVLVGAIVSQVQVFRFEPHFNGDELDFDTIKFLINPVEASASAMTICLRAKFQHLNAKCLYKGMPIFNVVYKNDVVQNGLVFLMGKFL